MYALVLRAPAPSSTCSGVMPKWAMIVPTIRRRDRDLYQGPQEGMEHPGLVAALGRLPLIRPHWRMNDRPRARLGNRKPLAGRLLPRAAAAVVGRLRHRRMAGPLCRSAAPRCRPHRVALSVAHGVEQGRRRARPPDQDLRIRQYDRVVPRALHHERQLERSGGASFAVPANRLAMPLRSRSRAGHRRRAGERQPRAGASMRMSSIGAVPCAIFRLTVSRS